MSTKDNYKKSGEKSDKDVIRRIQQGDKEAFAGLYQSYYPLMCDYARHMIPVPDICEELVQDVFLSIWERRISWQPKGSIRSYLFRAIHNRALDHIKHQKVEREWEKSQGEHTSYTESPHDRLVASELEKAIEKAVHKLPEKRKAIFLLSRVHGLTYREIADVLDLSVNTVETQMGRVLKILRELVLHHFS